MHEVNENSPVWSQVTSTRDNCLGQDCPNNKDCFVLKARREAMEADLVVVNHHLFFADVMLRDEGMAELLPMCNTVIFDEAHQLPEVATLFFGDSVSTSQVVDLARDARAEGLLSARDCLDLQDGSKRVEKVARDLRLAIGADTGRFSHGQLLEHAEFEPAMQTLDEELAVFANSRRPGAAFRRLGEMLAAGARTAADVRRLAESDRYRLRALGRGLHPVAATQFDAARRRQHFPQADGRPPACLDFHLGDAGGARRLRHYCAELGLGKPDSACWQSPFDYGKQAVLYAPLGMPDPNAWNYTDAVVDAAFPALKAAGGGAFFLCTSLRAMRRTHELLKARLEDEGLELPLLVQGEGSKTELLERFPAPGQRGAGR